MRYAEPYIPDPLARCLRCGSIRLTHPHRHHDFVANNPTAVTARIRANDRTPEPTSDAAGN